MKAKWIFLFSFLLAFVFAFAEEQIIPPRPSPPNLVVDFAGALSEEEADALRGELSDFAKQTSTQIQLVIVESLNGLDKADFAYKIGEEWGVGQEGFNNGIVILLKPFGDKSDRHAFIATGYGLEGIIPDATAKLIVENEMIPYFKQNDFYGGISSGIKTLKSLALSEFSGKEYANKQRKNKAIKSVFVIVLFVLVMIVVLIFKAKQAKTYSVKHKLSFWAAWMLLNQMQRSHGGYFSTFSSGGGVFRNSGSSGFGGYGGGSFGGGGAGGSW